MAVPKSGSMKTSAGGQRRVGDGQHDEPERPDAPGVARDEGRQREQQRDLAELGGLELEERELDPAARSACREAEREDCGDERDRPDVERPLEAAEALDVDEGERAQGDRAEREVDLLLDHERVGAGARADHVETERGNAGQREQHQPVETPEAAEEPDAARAAQLAGTHPLTGHEDARHQVDRSTTVLRFGFGVLKTLE